MAEEYYQYENDKKKKLDLKSKIILGLIGIAIVAAVVVLVVMLNRKESYDDDYFVSDDAKLVVAIDKELAAYDDSDYEPDVTYILYYYTGDDVTGMKVFFRYDTEEEAKEADENITMDGKFWATDKYLNGRYVIFNVDKEQYEGLVVSDIRKLIDDMKSAGTMYEPDEDTKNDVIDNDEKK
ncbi:hypothetical protein IKX73_01390 [Candidatus Saccharibacteria bacterium]|nr:hypothetical protein [Candidatus Saccharibacteria bacterium]